MIHLLKCHESICVEHFIKWYNISLWSADRNLTSNVIDKLIIKHWLLKYTLAILRKWIRKHETYFIYSGLAKLETCKPLLSSHHHGWALYMLHPLFLYKLRICGGAPHREICFFPPPLIIFVIHSTMEHFRAEWCCASSGSSLCLQYIRADGPIGQAQ